MSHLLFWPTTTFFYPVGNTSAVCLTENLTPESKADILLLACGDPRHILYTVYSNERNPLTSLRVFDITCCDADAAILARNALLFTFLVDNGAQDKLNNLWSLFYHMFVDQASLSMLFEQCHKLVVLAESMETWRAGPYGHFLAPCDAMTLRELRRVWNAYLDTATLSPGQAKHFEQHFIDGMKQMSRRTGLGGTTTAARSAGPLLLHVAQSVSRRFSSYWASGITDEGAHGQERRLTVNPTFAFSIDGDKFAVHYGTDPLCGFHLAEAYASGSTMPQGRISPDELVRVAKEQFVRWCMSLRKRLKGSNSSPTFVIRMFAGDALMLCQALKYCKEMHSATTPYNLAPWHLSTITLDGHCYGRGAVSPAPLSFDVIDTSNIQDHVGLVNVLVVTAPLLCGTHLATLYTEGLLRTGNDPSQGILERVCGDLPTMALLLGILPSTFISHFSTRSNVHEILTMDEDAKQYHERLAWKVVGPRGKGVQHGPDDTLISSQRISFSPEDLARFLFRVYVQMFSDEDVRSRLQLLSFSPKRMLRELQRSGVLHYNRRSFALFVHFVKTRVQTNWYRTMDLFEDLVMADGPLLTGQHAYHELACQLHLLGVYTTPWMSMLRLQHEFAIEDEPGPFRDWAQEHIPQVVTLVFVVPRDAIARLEPDFVEVGTPVLQCDMHDGPRQNWFAVTTATFGSLRVSGRGEHRTGVIIEASASMGADTDGPALAMQPPWRTKAPMIVTFSVPSISLMDFARNPRATVGLALRATMGTLLTDAEHVFVLARRPVVGTSVSSSAGGDTGAGIGAAVAGHWQMDMMQQATGNATVRVQMNDTISAVQSFTIRIDITEPDVRAALANVQTMPTVSSGSGPTQRLDARVTIGTHAYTAQFPLPIDVARAKLRVARKSSYVEVVVPPAPFNVPPERDLSDRFATLCLDPDDDGTPTLGSIHRINLDQCPMFKLPENTKINWFYVHICLMFSENEKQRALRSKENPPATNGNGINFPTPDTLVHVKQTLHLLLRSAGGVDPDEKEPGSVFALFDTSCGTTYLYIIVARMRLDVGSHTVVADAFVAPGTPAIRAALRTALSRQRPRNPDGVGIRYIATDADETEAWFYLLPRLTERCRTWPHKATCTYRTSKLYQRESGERAWKGKKDSPLCSCGAGIGTEILPREFERLAPSLTRAAFSPFFSVPYLEEPAGNQNMKEDSLGQKRGPLQHDRSADADNTNVVGIIKHRCRSCTEEGRMMCSRCKHAWYCSKECQRADWKVHKKDCRNLL